MEQRAELAKLQGRAGDAVVVRQGRGAVRGFRRGRRGGGRGRRQRRPALLADPLDEFGQATSALLQRPPEALLLGRKDEGVGGGVGSREIVVRETSREQDAGWVSDWGTNTMLRFDPATEKFQAFPSDRSGANVRQILGRPGEVWAPESGVNRLVVYRTR